MIGIAFVLGYFAATGLIFALTRKHMRCMHHDRISGLTWIDSYPVSNQQGNGVLKCSNCKQTWYT